MLLLASQILAVGLTILGLYALRRSLGLAAVFIFVASSQFLQNLQSRTVYVELLDRYSVSPGSAVLFSSSLFALLLIYLKEDIQTTRKLIYGILLANLTLAGVAFATRWSISIGQLQEVALVPGWHEHYELSGFMVGTGLLIFDTFLVIILYEVLRSRAGWMGMWGRLVFSLVLVLALDTLVFVGTVFRGVPGMTEILIGNLIGKSFAGVLFGTLLWGYLRATKESRSQQDSRELRDPLSILTFGERFRLLQEDLRDLEQFREREQHRAEVALRGAGVGAWDWNVQTNEQFFDDLWAKMLGYTRDESDSAFSSWEELIHPEDRDRVLESRSAHLQGRTTYYEVEHRLRTSSGDFKWILSMGKVVEWDRDGRPLLMTGALIDIDERKEAEARAHRLSRAVEVSLNEIYLFDETLCFLEVNRGACKNLGYSLEELRGLSVLDLQPEFTSEAFAQVLEPLRSGAQEIIEFTTVHARKDGTRYPVEVRIERIDAREPVFLAVVADITEREKVDKELRESREQLRRFALRLEEMREEERKALSREIHDRLGQSLTGLRLDLSGLERRLSGDRKGLGEEVAAMTSLLDGSIKEVQDLSSRLRPAILDDLGLGEAVRWQAREFSNRTDVEISVDTKGSLDVSLENRPDYATALFRILQEALTNIARHAEASRVDIRLSKVEDELLMEVKDNGGGIDPDKLQAPSSLGLLGMRERAQSCGGIVEVRPLATGGTTVSVRLPL